MTIPENEPRIEEASLRELLKKLGNDGALLVRQEMELVRSQMIAELDAVKRGMMASAVALGLLHGGFLLILFGLVLGIGLVVPLWLSLLFVAAASLAIGVAMLMRQRAALAAASEGPKRALAHVREDVAAVREAVR